MSMTTQGRRRARGLLSVMALIAVMLTTTAISSPRAFAAVVVDAPVSPLDPSNPFAAPSPLFDHAPPFDKIRDTDFAPALLAGMAEQRAEVAAIVANPEPPTFENTIVALDLSGEMLQRTEAVFFSLTASNTNDVLDKVRAEMAPKLAAHTDAIELNAALFARVQAVYDQRAGLQLDAESLRLVERTDLRFVRAGARLSELDKVAMRAINGQLATLQTAFGKHVQDDSNASAVVVDDRAQLDGLSDSDVAAAAAAASARHLDGKWLLALQNTTTQPVLATLKNRALRERIYKASIARGNHGAPNDTRQIVAEIVRLRARRAQLLGAPDFATYVLDDQMAKTPQAAAKLMTDIVPAAVANARKEAGAIQRLIDDQAHAAGTPSYTLQPWDWDYNAEQVRKATFDLDTAQIKPYFELDSVLQKGIFVAANKLYGLTFKERHDLPTYLPEVRVFEVFGADGGSLALVYFDDYARPSKRGGAWMSSFVDQSRLKGTRPVVVNNLNIVKPAAGQPTLLTFEEVTTVFHEFGHALHGMLSNVRYPRFSGTATPRDFVEFPSQFNENWALEPTVFASYARHYQTGAPMPPALVEKIKNARTFNQGYVTVEYLGAALLDLAWHALPADAPPQDVLKFEADALAKAGVAMDEVPPRYRSTYFNHIFNGGYAAGYYAYLWTEVLAQDAYVSSPG